MKQILVFFLLFLNIFLKKWFYINKYFSLLIICNLVKFLFAACKCFAKNYLIKKNPIIITSPGYPLEYCDNLNCMTTIEFDKGSYDQTIRLDVNAFSLEHGFDFLHIYDRLLQPKYLIRYRYSYNFTIYFNISSIISLSTSCKSKSAFQKFRVVLSIHLYWFSIARWFPDKIRMVRQANKTSLNSYGGCC